MSMLLLDVFDRRWARDTLARRGSRADTHYHIVTTFEAKESGAPGVLAQSLGISGRLEWLSEVVCGGVGDVVATGVIQSISLRLGNWHNTVLHGSTMKSIVRPMEFSLTRAVKPRLAQSARPLVGQGRLFIYLF
jgi:hypothetical protein